MVVLAILSPLWMTTLAKSGSISCGRNLKSLKSSKNGRPKSKTRLVARLSTCAVKNGGEYRDNRFMEFCKQQGITRHFTVKKTPQQNGAAERMNRTLMEKERCMRLHAGLPETFWAESVNYAAYLVNRSPSTLLDAKCAEEVCSGKDIDYSTLRVFGCKAYVHIPSDERNKLKPNSLECIFLGFEKGVKGYRLWDSKNKKKVLNR